MAGNRPRGRQKNVNGPGKGVYKRGSGLGTGPVGNSGGYSGRGVGRPAGSGNAGGSVGGGPRMTRGTRGGGGLMKYIILGIVVLLGGGGSLGSLFMGGGSGGNTAGYGGSGYESSYGGSQNGGYTQQSSGPQMAGTIDLSSILGGLGGGSISSGWDSGANTGKLDTTVAKGSREKHTEIFGNGKDEVTLMVYMCGTDLESRSGMATSDLQEMLNANISENVNVVVYTGGCKAWKNNVINSRTNQIWQVKDDGLVCLEKDLGTAAMTDPDTLSDFIQWSAKKFPANRYSLIFWDHGGGSVSGFGYDEKFASSGSMDLAEIDKALSKGGVTFDFVGYDACLMATAENALMLAKHADYLIASEETEPGVGWYYTNWLTELSENTSMPTLDVGKKIIDDFVDVCAQKCRGQSTTLSIIDLAEFENTVPANLTAFSSDTCELIRNNEYKVVSNARSGAREFGVSSRIDQVDLVHLAKNMGTEEGDALAEALLGAVKYNRTSSNMTNSYGVSIYFPFQRVSKVDSAVATYEQIDMDEEYIRCIQEFASLEASGQAVSGGTASPLPSLTGMYGNSGMMDPEMMAQFLGTFLGGNVGSISGLVPGNTGFLSDRSMSMDDMVIYLSENQFDGNALVWTETGDGMAIALPEEQWELVQTLHANMFFDDGEGYIDLGLDTVYEFDDAGNLLAPAECTWIAVNDQPVAYYHESTVDDGEDYTITGYIPVLHNGVRGELLVVFTDEEPYGEVTGVRTVYTEGETDTIPKTMDPVVDGDTLDFICDYYSYEGEYLDSYLLGEQMVVDGDLVISDVYVDEAAAEFTYRFTDIYNQEYWTTPAP
ncbi:MAG: peptidase C11 [Lachnospiraceae bacterium]|nr:peptidase C11 [Lachnospiraceae bacterium]